MKKFLHVRWDKFSKSEQILIENTSVLVGLLYKMCKVNLVNKSKDETKPGTINKIAISNSMAEAKSVLQDLAA